MKKFKSIKNKGSWFIDNLGHLILMAIAVGVGIYLMWAFVLHGGGDTFNAVQKCEALTLGSGECKESCDSTLELEFPDAGGCKGITNKCCIRKDENAGDVILPSGYGGDNTHDFEVVSIRFGTRPNNCQLDTRNPDTVMICTPNNLYSIPVSIVVQNTGTNAIPRVYADPVAVMNGNGDNIRGPGRYNTGTGMMLPVTGTKTVTVTTSVGIAASDAKPNYYWDIYPYASCTDTVCRSTDSNSRGILSMNGDRFVTVKFVS
jgi:hypothetical protein